MHRVINHSSEDMRELEDSSIHLVVTSPPYNSGVAYNVYDDSKPTEEYFSLLEAVKKAADAKGAKYQSVAERLRDVAGYAKDLGFRDVESSANTAAKAVELAAALDGEGIAQLAKNLGVVAVGDVRADLKNIAIRLLDEPARAAEENATAEENDTDASVAEKGGKKRVSAGGEDENAELESLVDQIVGGVSL